MNEGNIKIEQQPKYNFEEFEKNWAIFKPVFDTLTDEEKKVMYYIHFFFSGDEEHKLTNQDELEKSLKEKLSKAGIDVENLGKYLEVADIENK